VEVVELQVPPAPEAAARQPSAVSPDQWEPPALPAAEALAPLPVPLSNHRVVSGGFGFVLGNFLDISNFVLSSLSWSFTGGGVCARTEPGRLANAKTANSARSGAPACRFRFLFIVPPAK